MYCAVVFRDAWCRSANCRHETSPSGRSARAPPIVADLVLLLVTLAGGSCLSCWSACSWSVLAVVWICMFWICRCMVSICDQSSFRLLRCRSVWSSMSCWSACIWCSSSAKCCALSVGAALGVALLVCSSALWKHPTTRDVVYCQGQIALFQTRGGDYAPLSEEEQCALLVQRIFGS